MVAVRLDEQAIGQNILILTYREIKRERKKQSHIHRLVMKLPFKLCLFIGILQYQHVGLVANFS